MKKDNFYKTQIEGLLDVTETVRVIEKSAASHIHFLKKKVRALSAYKQQIQRQLQRLSRFYWDDNHPFLKQKSAGKSALLVITGEKGMVGGLYHELINEVTKRSNDYEAIFIVGTKGRKYLSEEGIQAEHIFTPFNFDDLPHSEEINKMADRLFEQFQGSAIKKIEVLYATFISLAKQSPTVTKFLPFDFASAATKSSADKQDKLTDGLPIFEPSKKFIFDALLKKYIDVSFAQIILEAKLSEFAARTVTAESAVKETERLVRTLRREFLKAKHLTTAQKQVEGFSVHQLIRI